MFLHKDTENSRAKRISKNEVLKKQVLKNNNTYSQDKDEASEIFWMDNEEGGLEKLNSMWCIGGELDREVQRAT